MSVIIKNFNKPKICTECIFIQHGILANWCYINQQEIPCVCPLQSVEEKTINSNLFDTEEIHSNCTVQILSNSITGQTSVGWWDNIQSDNRCPYCGGLLSEIRIQNNKPHRHCYGCHFEFDV